MSAADSPEASSIRKWLETQGYPLEMASAKIFRSEGFTVFQSEFYLDPQTNVYREVDVVAWKQVRLSEHLLRVELVAECKSSLDRPWVMVTTWTH
jgi:hypothetical protein